MNVKRDAQAYFQSSSALNEALILFLQRSLLFDDLRNLISDKLRQLFAMRKYIRRNTNKTHMSSPQHCKGYAKEGTEDARKPLTCSGI